MPSTLSGALLGLLLVIGTPVLAGDGAPGLDAGLSGKRRQTIVRASLGSLLDARLLEPEGRSEGGAEGLAHLHRLLASLTDPQLSGRFLARFPLPEALRGPAFGGMLGLGRASWDGLMTASEEQGRGAVTELLARGAAMDLASNAALLERGNAGDHARSLLSLSQLSLLLEQLAPGRALALLLAGHAMAMLVESSCPSFLEEAGLKAVRAEMIWPYRLDAVLSGGGYLFRLEPLDRRAQTRLRELVARSRRVKARMLRHDAPQWEDLDARTELMQAAAREDDLLLDGFACGPGFAAELLHRTRAAARVQTARALELVSEIPDAPASSSPGSGGPGRGPSGWLHPRPDLAARLLDQELGVWRRAGTALRAYLRCQVEPGTDTMVLGALFLGPLLDQLELGEARALEEQERPGSEPGGRETAHEPAFLLLDLGAAILVVMVPFRALRRRSRRSSRAYRK